MHQVRPWLVIGNYRSSQSLPVLQQFKIGAVLQLAGPVHHSGINCLYVPVEDGEPVSADKLMQGITFIREQKAEGHVVLSACGAGISRSTTYAMSAIMAEENITWREAYESILPIHPGALPNAHLVNALLAHLGEKRPPLEDLWHDILKMQQRHTLT